MAAASTSKITKYSSVDQMCTVLQKVGLADCVPMIRKYNVDGQQLLESTQEGFITMLTKEGMLDFQGRTKWRALQPHLQYSSDAHVEGVDTLSRRQQPQKTKSPTAVSTSTDSRCVWWRLLSYVLHIMPCYCSRRFRQVQTGLCFLAVFSFFDFAVLLFLWSQSHVTSCLTTVDIRMPAHTGGTARSRCQR